MFEPEIISSVPTHWCNFAFDHPEYAARETLSLPVIDEKISRHVSIVPQQPLSLAKQSNNTTEPNIPIPEPVLAFYRRYRPTPLRRAARLEAHLGVNARIYFKFEGANISGSHKLNTALAQAYYYSQAGVRHLVTGTGAGQWGTAIAYACQQFGLECTVFMVGASLRQKPQRASMMELFGATVYESPTTTTKVGRDAIKRDPGRVGTLAFATGEALEFARERKRTRFAVGSGENCVLLHQTVVGIEAAEQMLVLGDFPDHVVACMGAGSNFGGVGLPFLRAAREAGRSVRLLAVEPSVCPKLTRGTYAYDINDFSGTTPVTKMYTLGSKYIAPPIHAGGLRYHGTSPFLSAMYADRMFDAMAVDESVALGAGLLFAQTENILAAPESAHAIAGAIELARRHPRDAKPTVILINISGHGLLDIDAYTRFRANELCASRPDDAMLRDSLREVEKFNELIEASHAGVGGPAR